MKVLYITGWCRSGSTILGNLLGEVPGVVHVGEVHYLWRNGVLGSGTNTSCGCGKPVPDCPLWNEVIERVAGDEPTDAARRAVEDQRRYLRTRHTGRRLAEARGARPVEPGALTAVDRLLSVYRAVADATGARVVVDSSKYPAEAAALLGRARSGAEPEDAEPEVDLRVLHLVRDPRATAHSWRRAKAYIPAMGVARSTAYWTAFNLASDRVVAAAGERGLRLRYEDFARAPRATLTEVMALLGVTDPAPVDDAGRGRLGVNHTVTGNPDRLVHGPVQVRPDEAWRAELPSRAALLATALAAPALTRYGYRYRH
ncbi:MAG TPA: sulfotransferase [Micromonosporaceae bacterium]